MANKFVKRVLNKEKQELISRVEREREALLEYHESIKLSEEKIKELEDSINAINDVIE